MNILKFIIKLQVFFGLTAINHREEAGKAAGDIRQLERVFYLKLAILITVSQILMLSDR